ncbi:MAG: hypothetical protein IT514_16195, partial [Burkholderiales bacterium]|nr:hypothetical protein [Burkholderiales bacterium]
MSRQLVHPDQPWPLRMVLHVYQFAASLKLAVILILWLVATFAIGTFVEARYGTPVAQFGVYQTWWFSVLAVLLAVNIFCAASIRFPWKRHQTGFVITHLGLLTLLLGVALSRLHGIDAQIFVYERQANAWALEDERMHLDLVVHREGTARRSGEVQTVSADDITVEPLEPIEFTPGPFTWSDYQTEFRFGPLTFAELWEKKSLLISRSARWASGWMFRIAGRDVAGQALYDHDGIRLEVLDYLADSRKVNAPQITVAMSQPRSERIGADGRTVKSRYHWMQQTLELVEIPRGKDYPFGVSDKAQFPGGTASFAMTDVPEQRAAFLANKPAGPLGERGQVVLFIEGQPRRF